MRKSALSKLEIQAKSLRKRVYHLPGGHDQDTHGNDKGAADRSDVDQLITVLSKANDTWPSTKASQEQLAKVAGLMHGKSRVDPLKIEDEAGVSVGLAIHLREAHLSYVRAHGPTKARSRGERIDSYLKQRWLGPVKR